MKDAGELITKIGEFAADLRQQRAERQRRTHLDPADFGALRQLGIHKISIPEQAGGSWQDVQRSIRPLCEVHRILAAAGPSLALRLTMHPGVLAFWRDSEPPPKPEPAWERQKQDVSNGCGRGGVVGNDRFRARKRWKRR